MSIASEISRLQTSKTDVKTQVNIDKDIINGGTAFIDNETVDDYDDKIEEMQDAYKKYIPIQTNTKIDNSDEDKIITDITLYGNTTQIITTGKNLFNGYTKGIGINATTGEETSGSTKASSGYIPVDFTNNPSYTISGMLETLSNFVGAYNSSKQFLGRTGATGLATRLLKDNSFTSGTPAGTGSIAYLRVTFYETSQLSGVIDDIDNAEMQLEVGATATSYEPYSGELPSPSPSYPQTINVVTGNNSIVNSGKNLWKKTFQVAARSISTGELETASVWVVNTEAQAVNPNTTYTVSQTETPIQYIILYFNGTTYLSYEQNTINTTVGYKTYTFTTPNNCDNIYIQWRSTLEIIASTGSYAMSVNAITNVQLEENSTATAYEVYRAPTVYPVNLGAKNYFDKNNINLMNGYYIDYVGKIVEGSNNKFNWIKLDSNKEYVLNQPKKSNVTVRVALFSSQPTIGSTGTIIGTFTGGDGFSLDFTTTNTNYYVGWVYCNTANLNGYTLDEMVNSISLTERIELCRGDKLYKNRSNGKWYKYVASGRTTDTSGSTGITINDMQSDGFFNSYYGGTLSGKTITYSGAISGENTIYYELATPTTEEITDTELISQLEAIHLKTGSNIFNFTGNTLVSQLDINYIGEANPHL